MDGIIIITLVSLQLVSFFFIVILFAKLSKFKDLERKQEQIVEEMDAALGAYLMEMKEENDRLIQQLSTIPKQQMKADLKVKDAVVQQKVMPPIQPISKFVSSATATSTYKSNLDKQSQLEESAMLTPNSTIVKKQETVEKLITKTGQAQIYEEEMHIKELSFEEMVVEMYQQGQSIEEIAKSLNKGKTEIELLIKFHT